MLYPLTFRPIFKERVWGGRNLERLFGKRLPPGQPIGESWEISDRPGDVSVVTNGPLAGRDLHWLVQNHCEELLGSASLQAGRFPLLIKLLDAQEKLSLQVHPPASKAIELGGDPKTEIWLVADATPTAELYVGLKHGMTKASFEQKLRDGSVADCFHRVSVRAGDVMFLPSGRVHAIGAGVVIFEIQQNSDTTYRVFDWNRKGLDGKPRELHVAQSLASVDFTDFEPRLVETQFTSDSTTQRRMLVSDPLFGVEEWRMGSGESAQLRPRQMHVVACVIGKLRVAGADMTVKLTPGSFCLVPACVEHAEAFAETATSLLLTEAN